MQYLGCGPAVPRASPELCRGYQHGHRVNVADADVVAAFEAKGWGPSFALDDPVQVGGDAGCVCRVAGCI